MHLYIVLRRRIMNGKIRDGEYKEKIKEKKMIELSKETDRFVDQFIKCSKNHVRIKKK